MQTVSLDVEAITPLFIAGADQSQIEGEGLRSPTLRGLMRWWFRAIMGGMADERTLREKEGEIFGSTKARSKVRVLTDTVDGRLVKIDQISGFNELRYLWFSIKMQYARGQRLFCYQPGSKFSITLMSDDSDALRIAAGTLWTMIYLGGVGARMRRGAGSLRVIKADDDESHCDFAFRGSRIAPDAVSFLSKNLQVIFNSFRKLGDPKKALEEPTFSVLSKKTAKIVLVSPRTSELFNRYEDGLKEISDIYQQYRGGVRDRFGRKQAGGIPTRDRFVFGLPIQRIYVDLRQASPFLIGVMRLDNKYAIRLVKFYTSVHPKFVEKSGYVKTRLDELDNEFNRRFTETVVEIPEVN